MNHPTNESRESDEPREDDAYWRECARAEREHSRRLMEERVRANVLRTSRWPPPTR